MSREGGGSLLDDGAEGHPIDGSDAYGAELWPSSLVAAVALVERCRPGNTVLELGCGAGLTTLAALDAGAKVTATDWSPFSLALVEASAEAFQPSRRDKLRTMHFDVCDPQLEPQTAHQTLGPVDGHGADAEWERAELHAELRHLQWLVIGVAELHRA